MDEYISKPIRMHEVTAKLREVMSRAESTTDNAESADGNPGSNADGTGDTSPGENGETIVDWARALKSVNGDPGLLSAVIRAYLAESPGLMSAIRTAVEESQSQDLKTAAHTLKGALLFLGPSTVLDQAECLELMGRSGRMGDARSALPRMEEQFGRMSAEMASFLDRPPSTT